MKKNRKFEMIFICIVMALIFIPIVVTIIYSFNESRISSVWGGFSLKWYRELFRDRDMFKALGNSVLIAVLSCLISAVIGTLGAIGIKKSRFRLNPVISFVSSLPIMTPEIILGMVYLLIFSFMGIPFGIITLVIAHTAFCIPYIFINVSARLEGLDPHLEEAARDMGASPMRVFFDITLPSIIPALLSGMLLSFAMSFDDVVISIFVTGASVNTLPIKIYTRMKNGVTPEINAIATLLIAATVLVILIGRIAKSKKR
ncbi:MAG: ABC transporter permease [Lachnospiraceae bacterium]|jgi:spermidine/putrescine transport system permease protein